MSDSGVAHPSFARAKHHVARSASNLKRVVGNELQTPRRIAREAKHTVGTLLRVVPIVLLAVGVLVGVALRSFARRL